MPVVGVLVDLRVGPRVGIDRMRPDEVGAGDHVPEMAVDRVDEEQLAERVPVVAPGIGRAVGEDFESFAIGMVPPDSAAERHAQGFGRARGADLPGRRCPAAPIQPAVGPPSEAIGKRVIVLGGNREAVEHNFGRPVGHVVAISIGQEQQPRRAHEPDAARNRARCWRASEHGR